MNSAACASLRFSNCLAILTFLPLSGFAQFTPAAGSPFAIGMISGFVTGDFNGDGHLDLAAVNTTSNTVMVLLGSGVGNFRAGPGRPFAVRSGSKVAAVADFNRNGRLDLVLVNRADNNVTVLLGNGSGEFRTAPGSPFAVGTKPEAVAAGDFNGDGRPDLAIADFGDSNGGNVSVMLGNGAGGFSAAAGSPFALGMLNPTAIALGDFNRDGKLDIAVGFLHSVTPAVLLGNGAGRFSVAGKPVAEPVLCGVVSIAVADFNRDGNLDVAVACSAHQGTLSVLLGNGSGGFSAPSFGLMGEPHTVSMADFNEDGIPDLAVFETGPRVIVLFGNGAGGFVQAPGSPYQAGLPIATGNGGLAAVGEFNGDRKPDIVALNPQGSSLTVLLNSIERLTDPAK